MVSPGGSPARASSLPPGWAGTAGSSSPASWLLRNRRLVRRYDRKAEHFQAFADLAAALLSYRRLAKATK